MLGPELAGAVMVGTGMVMSGALMLGSAMSPGSRARARACIDKHESNIDDRIMHPGLIRLTTTKRQLHATILKVARPERSKPGAWAEWSG